MEWFIAGLIIGVGGIVGNAVQNYQNGKAQRKEADRQYNLQLDSLLTGYQNNLETLLLESLPNAQLTLEQAGLELSDLSSQLSERNDWLKAYQDMLSGAGDDTLSQTKQLLEQNIALAKQKEELIKQQNNAYAEASALEIESAIKSGWLQLNDARQSQAMANVQAGATGSVVGAMTSSAIRTKEQIRKYIGNDMVFDIDSAEEGEDSGVFAREVMSIRTNIALQVEANRLNLEAANAAISQAQLQLDTQMEEWEETAEQFQFDVETSLPKRQELLQKQIDNAKQQIEYYQETAKQKLDQWRSTASERGKSSSEIEEFTSSWKDRFKQAGIDIGEEGK